MINQFRSKRKISGGRYIAFRKKRKANLGRESTFTKLGERKVKVIRTRGANKKQKVFQEKKINVLNKKDNSYKVVEIQDVIDNTANRNYIRRKIITKGAVVKTELGNVKITSRPGQTGTLNGVLVEE